VLLTHNHSQSDIKMEAKGIYIYGIIPNFYSPELFRSLESSGVYTISFQNMSAIVSQTKGLTIDYSDRESLALMLVNHQKTIEAVQARGFNMIIPMRLGTIVASKEEVIHILENGYTLINTTLGKIEHMTEIDLAVTWSNFTDVLESISNLPDIRKMKMELTKNNSIISMVDRVKVGICVQDLLKQNNQTIELKILDALSAVGTDIKVNEVMNDEMITNSAFLLRRDKIEKFESLIDQIDEEYDGLLNFKLVGPLPCYSFFTLEVKELSPELIEKAKMELGLKEMITDSDIKKAYLEKAKVFHPDTHMENALGDGFNKINEAYHTMLDYIAAARQSSKDEQNSLEKKSVHENLMLVTLKN
jgi:hypothetical protein